MTVWFKIGDLKRHHGTITDTFMNFVEIQDDETGEYYIVDYLKTDLLIKI